MLPELQCSCSSRPKTAFLGMKASLERPRTVKQEPLTSPQMASAKTQPQKTRAIRKGVCYTFEPFNRIFGHTPLQIPRLKTHLKIQLFIN